MAGEDGLKFALLIYLAVKVTHAVDLECPHTVSCPCGSVGVNVTYVTVCVPGASVYEEVCASLSKCENCDEGLCSKCPEGLDGPFCSQEIHKSRQKRQSSYFTRSWRKQPRAVSIISSCPSMDSPKLGSIRCISSNELQTCTGKCLPGYRFTNSPEDEMVLTCRGGQWSPRSSFPACKSGGHCDLIVVGSGSFNCTTGMDGTRCDVQCSGSYVGRFFCYPGRNWEPPLPRCVKPKNPVDSTEGRQSCVCRNGEICNSRGQCMPKGCHDGWTRAECEAALAGNQRKSCPDPGTIANGYRRNTDGSDASARRNFEEGQSVVYGCTSEEYELKGYFILTCKKDGTWSRSRPSCVKLPPVAPKLVCPDPGQIANANRLNTDGSPSQAVRPPGQPEYPVGHSLVYTCVPGYALERRPLITCLASGKWSYRTPFCRRIPPTTTTTEKPAPDMKICRDPGVDPNGLREESLPPDNRGFQAGTQLSYSCKEGYDLVGAKNLFCLFQGWWSADRPVCAPMSRTPNVTPLVYCEYPGDIPDGRVFHIPTLNERRRPSDEREEAYPEGSRLQYSCNDGFTLQGPATLTCRNNGRWSTLPPRCALIDVVVDVYCPNPGPISNGHVVYRPAINNRRRPTPEPIEPDDPEFPVGGRLRYTCNSGYALVGRSNLVCLQSGSWSVDKPVCRIVERPIYCNYPGDLGNGQMVHYPPANEMRRPMESGEQYPADSRLGYSCDEGFTLEGPAVLECLRNGSWSAKPPTCITEELTEIMYCENLGPIPNGRVQYFPPAIKQRSGPGPALDYDLDDYPEGSMLEYNCDEGYKLVGRRTLTCQSTSYWSAKPPICELDCGRSFMQTTGKVFNGVNTTSGEWPWVVSISLDNNGSSPFICGGAVLNTHTVITAAHCLQGNRPLLLRFGKHHFNVQDDDTEVLTRRSSRVIIHPEYSNITLDSDIGLIYFQPRIRYSIRVQPICLPTRDTTVRNTEPGQVGYVGGWGETERAIPPEKMMLASLPVVSNEVCMDAYRQQNLVITRNMFCAGYDDSRQSVCQGDSGSPFVFYNKREERYTLEGVVSFGVRGQCGVAGKYAIFTKVFRFILWITKNSK